MGWIGVDLDGTLAQYNKFVSLDHIGAPIPAMVDRVKKWLEEGREVRIMTARVATPWERSLAVGAIEDWCVAHIGQKLPVTSVQDQHMIELWDDRAVQVEKNTGRVLGHSTRGLT